MLQQRRRERGDAAPRTNAQSHAREVVGAGICGRDDDINIGMNELAHASACLLNFRTGYLSDMNKRLKADEIDETDEVDESPEVGGPDGDRRRRGRRRR